MGEEPDDDEAHRRDIARQELRLLLSRLAKPAGLSDEEAMAIVYEEIVARRRELLGGEG
jgi:hypothetical protein